STVTAMTTVNGLPGVTVFGAVAVALMNFFGPNCACAVPVPTPIRPTAARTQSAARLPHARFIYASLLSAYGPHPQLTSSRRRARIPRSLFAKGTAGSCLRDAAFPLRYDR